MTHTSEGREAAGCATKSQVRTNAEADTNYSPYCMRCSTMTRMRIVEPMFWRCACGAEHDERRPVPPASAPAATPEPGFLPTRTKEWWLALADREGDFAVGAGSLPAAPTGGEAGPGFHFTEPRRCVECEGCGFAFEATHSDSVTGTYSCPVCEETAQASELAALRARVTDTEALLRAFVAWDDNEEESNWDEFDTLCNTARAALTEPVA